MKRKKIQSLDSNVPLILVVEDEKDNLLFISHTLIYLKYNFITATTGQDAFNLATQYEIDLVLLDLLLPDINGFELVERWKKHKLTQHMTILAVSALVRPEEKDRAMRLGCADYIKKPYWIDEIERKISQYLPQSWLSKISFLKGLKKRQNQSLKLFGC